MGEQIDADIPNCSECGALSRDGLTCQERLHGILALEQADFALQTLHFLTVAAYNIQHPAQFDDDAIEGLRRSFADYLDNKITTGEIMQMGQEFDGAKRFLKPFTERHTVLRIWPVTTADVYIPSQPQGTAGRLEKWIESVKNEL